MKKLALDVDALQVQSFTTDEVGTLPFGTVHAYKKTGLQDIDCSAIDACVTARGCSEIAECPPSKDPQGCQSQVDACLTRTPDCKTAQCPSADDACPSGRGCPPQA